MEIANLKTIIGRFSDFSRMPKPQLERIDANESLRRVVQLYFPAASGAAAMTNRESTIECTLEAAPDPLWIDADPELLHRALSNLVLNAMDAMPDGGSLTVTANSCEDKVEIRVSDTGEGLTPEECERLFTPYYTTKQHGTGLGLAIVQSIVADHNGAIAVESRAGGGATFVITLPRADGTAS
jgi:signal transduction histidine kinase